jgi:hypothetical protein
MWPFKPSKQKEPAKTDVEQWTKAEQKQLKELGLDKPTTMLDIRRAFLNMYKRLNRTEDFAQRLLHDAEKVIVRKREYSESKDGLVDKLDREVGERARAYEALEKRVEELERKIGQQDLPNS